MDSATTGIIGTAELQDLTTNTVNSTAVPADVNQVIAAAAAAASVTAEEAANALVGDKETAEDVRHLDSSGYLAIPPSAAEGDTNSQEANQQSFITYGDHGTNSTEVNNLFNSAASQLAAAGYPYIYEGSTYAPLTNSPLTNALVSAQSSINQGNTASLQTNTGTNGQQFVSYNGETYILQPSPNGTQLVATLNTSTNRSISPTNQTTAGILQIEKSFNANVDLSPSNSDTTAATATQISSNIQSYITRVSPSTIQWLISNYETAEGVSLPRSTLYNHYQRHCAETKQEPVNAASFGKLIRSVFLGLRTRRIGTRGNSKYHYYGIRVKPTSILNQFQDEVLVHGQYSNNNIGGGAANNSIAASSNFNGSAVVSSFSSAGSSNTGGQKQIQQTTNSTAKKKTSSNNVTATSGKFTNEQSTTATSNNMSNLGDPANTALGTNNHHNMKQFLGQFSIEDSSNPIPGFPLLDLTSVNNGSTSSTEEIVHLGQVFEDLYKQHASILVQTVFELNFSSIETLWKSFWSITNEKIIHNIKQEEPSEDLLVGHNKENQGHCGSTGEEGGEELKKQNKQQNQQQRIKSNELLSIDHQMMKLLNIKEVQIFIHEADFAVYQYLIDLLLPKVLKPIPNSLTQGIRTFSKNLESWLNSALISVPEELKYLKINAVKSFAQTLRRYTGLNHLAQAARAVLQNPEQVNQMLNDLNKVDFANLQEQATWICQCDTNLVQNLDSEFKTILGAPADLETWAEWLQSVVNKVLIPSSKESRETFVEPARQFLKNWSFYSSLIIRDLTLRSAASFGSFHLIRLLFDEYMFYLVEQKVAEVMNQSPVSVIGRENLKLHNLKYQEMNADEPKPKYAKLNGDS